MDLDIIKDSVVEFVRVNHAWAPFIVAGLAFGESLAFLSLLTPATVILVGIGVLIGAGALEFWPLWLGASLGAISGDCISYEVGRRMKQRAFGLWPLSRHPRLVTSGELFFGRYGSWGVFAGRFFGPVRAVTPLVAGVFSMPFVLFLMVTVSSAFVWAFVLLAPGAGLVELLLR